MKTIKHFTRMGILAILGLSLCATAFAHKFQLIHITFSPQHKFKILSYSTSSYDRKHPLKAKVSGDHGYNSYLHLNKNQGELHLTVGKDQQNKCTFSVDMRIPASGEHIDSHYYTSDPVCIGEYAQYKFAGSSVDHWNTTVTLTP